MILGWVFMVLEPFTKVDGSFFMGVECDSGSSAECGSAVTETEPG